jgi:hypothetical protein
MLKENWVLLFRPCRRRRAAIGVDVSSSALKLVELAGPERAPSPRRYAIEPLTKDLCRRQHYEPRPGDDALRPGTSVSGAETGISPWCCRHDGHHKKIIVPAGQTEEELELRVRSGEPVHSVCAGRVNLDFQILDRHSTTQTRSGPMPRRARKRWKTGWRPAAG